MCFVIHVCVYVRARVWHEEKVADIRGDEHIPPPKLASNITEKNSYNILNWHEWQGIYE